MMFGLRSGILLLAAVGTLAGGCAMIHQDDLRMTRYHPVEKSSRGKWLEAESPAPAPAPTNKIASVPGAPSGPRVLRVGDKVLISRRGIPREDEIRDIIDEKGEINLDLIGSVRIDGKTTSEAEELIEDAYIQGGFFRNINVVVIGQDDEYYIRGEVMRPGRYPLPVSMTLMRAVTAAGGFTDYADPKSIDIFRGDKATRVDAKKIQSLEADDPAIHGDDMIVVGRKWIL